MLFTRRTHRVEFVSTAADPFYAEGSDEPLTTPEQAAGWVAVAHDAIFYFASFCAGMAARHFLF